MIRTGAPNFRSADRSFLTVSPSSVTPHYCTCNFGDKGCHRGLYVARGVPPNLGQGQRGPAGLDEPWSFSKPLPRYNPSPSVLLDEVREGGVFPLPRLSVFLFIELGAGHRLHPAGPLSAIRTMTTLVCII